MRSTALLGILLTACAERPTGTLSIRILDATRGTKLPARLELIDARGEAWVAADAVPLRFECLLQPLPDWAAERVSISRELRNPHTGTTHFKPTAQPRSRCRRAATGCAPSAASSTRWPSNRSSSTPAKRRP